MSKVLMFSIYLVAVTGCKSRDESVTKDVATDLGTEGQSKRLYFVNDLLMNEGLCIKGMPTIRTNCQQVQAAMPLEQFVRLLTGSLRTDLLAKQREVENLKIQIQNARKYLAELIAAKKVLGSQKANLEAAIASLVTEIESCEKEVVKALTDLSALENKDLKVLSNKELEDQINALQIKQGSRSRLLGEQRQLLNQITEKLDNLPDVTKIAAEIAVLCESLERNSQTQNALEVEVRLLDDTVRKINSTISYYVFSDNQLFEKNRNFVSRFYKIIRNQ